MNKTFQVTITLLMIVMVFALIGVFMVYYNNKPFGDIQVIPSDFTTNPSLLENEKEININVIDEINDVTKNIADEKPEGIIVSSDINTSNIEKQQVLTEIDSALNELLIVVDKVQTVDETRLGIDENGEVQP